MTSRRPFLLQDLQVTAFLKEISKRALNCAVVILANATHRMWGMSREDMDVRSDQNPVKLSLDKSDTYTPDGVYEQSATERLPNKSIIVPGNISYIL